MIRATLWLLAVLPCLALVTCCAVANARGASLAAPRGETIVLLHGMGRTRISLKLLEGRLRAMGYETANFPYGTAGATLEENTAALHEFIEAEVKTERYHLLGHSLGNVIIRDGFRRGYRPGLTRVVMLAPPNQRPALAALLRDNFVFRRITGDSGQRLAEADFFDSLPRPDVEFGVIAGSRGLRIYLDEPNDGIVTTKGTRLEGMADWLVVNRTHTFIMNAPETARLCERFFETGDFGGGAIDPLTPERPIGENRALRYGSSNDQRH